jgi:hypothetical protein
MLEAVMLALIPNGRGAETDSCTAPAAVRIISGDSRPVRGPRSMIWQDCGGTGRVAEENTLPGLWAQQG